MVGMSLLWHDIRLYLSFQRVDEGKSVDRVVGEQEPDVLKIHLEQFLLPVVPADPTVYISQPPPSGGSSVSAAKTKKPTRVKITGRKVMTVRATTAPMAVSISVALEGATAVSAPTSVTQVEGMSSVPLTTGDVMSSAAGGSSLSDLISQASVVVVSSSILPPVFTTTVVVTPSPVSTPLFSIATPMSLFDSPIGVFSASEIEMPTASVACKSTSARDTVVSDAGGSSSGFADDGARLGDDLYLPTICWDPNAQDKRYQPKWKIA
ncbi:hypothetical protein Hanom_Chr13g01227921 [Helianthus anomalus]